MKKINYNIYKFLYKNYEIEIIEKKDIYESYLQEKNTGIKYFMFGLLKKDINLDIYTSIVYGNLNKYIKIYNERFGE